MLSTNKEQINQVYECVKSFHSLESFPLDLPDPEHENLAPTLRPYQVRAVKWMLHKEISPVYFEWSQDSSTTHSFKTDSPVLLPKGGILAEEMGLGKTVEVLACILANPRKMDDKSESNNVSAGGSISKTINYEDVKPENSETPLVVPFNTHNLTDVGTVEVCSDNSKANENSNIEVISNSDKGYLNNIGQSETVSLKETVSNSRRSKKRVKFETEPSSPPVKKKCMSSIEIVIEETIKKYYPEESKKAKKPSENWSVCYEWYQSRLLEMSVGRDRRKSYVPPTDLQCCCVKDVISDDLVECPDCKTTQHAECVGYDVGTADYPYYCSRCWQDKPLVPSAGTVIISPEAISQQWASEIKKHVNKEHFKVLVYEGVRVTGYIQPHDLADYDIIITTYEVLTRELNYTDQVSRSLRHAKRYHAPTSPLLCVQWWRLCLDEAQMVEGSSCRAALMAKKFTAINKWAVTGTPIQKAVNDLVGLMEFLAGSEYPEFLSMISRDWRSLLRLVPRVLWRTQMKDVLVEVGVPLQTTQAHMLDFSKIESYFYQCTHTECSHQFVQRINRFEDLNVTLKSVDRKLITRLLNPLLRLRQACLHPQAVRGKFLSMKKTMTMEDLVVQMVANAKQDAEQALRQQVASLNGAAALHCIRQEWRDAVDAYRTVMHLEQDHSGKLKIDSLQRIHTMFNLAEVLDKGYDGIAPTLRDSSMRDDIKALEMRYLGRWEGPMLVTLERIDQHQGAIAEMLQGATIGYSDWWLQLMRWSTDRDELLDRLKAAIQHTDMQQKNQYNKLAQKMNSMGVVEAEVAQWLAEVDSVREQARDYIRELRIGDKAKFANDALSCHLPQASLLPYRARNRCELCNCESILNRLEALLFEERSRDKRKNKQRNLPGSSDWGENKDMDNRQVAELVGVNVNTFESSKKGGFKASPIERILKALATYGRQNRAPAKWTKEATKHAALLDRVKKEILDLNLMWRHIYDQVDAIDELNMCKTRLRLPYPEEEVDRDQRCDARGKKRKVGENYHIIEPAMVEPELHKLQVEKVSFEELLKKKVGTLTYLENMQKHGPSKEAAICPICRNELTDKWSVLQCGHCLCLDCLSVILNPMSTSVPCPQCRQPCSLPEVSYVESKPTQSQPEGVKGSHSTKVYAVVKQTLELMAQEPHVKIIVFSAWEKVLDLLGEAFNENNITFRRLKADKKRKRENIKDFKTKDVTVLLLPLRSGAKGLNLVEATHVFLVEPILNPADEMQAVGRVHRIGQTRPTVVHRFIVKETIEERIVSAVAASGAEQWSDHCVTLQQLLELFSREDNSLPPSHSSSEPMAIADSDSGSDNDGDTSLDATDQLLSDDDN